LDESLRGILNTLKGVGEMNGIQEVVSSILISSTIQKQGVRQLAWLLFCLPATLGKQTEGRGIAPALCCSKQLFLHLFGQTFP